ncbi:MAG: sulfurtransferase-like selenium metabolism protein YedF [Gemmatimonadota bacterium]|nr:MAG: sulfurtransferase-like selenium metabolism protein YedF [Gemmatimonadota bacterium]
MAEKVDARGLSCPQPVVMTKKALEQMESGILDVLVDNRVSSENVARFAQSAGCDAEIEEREGVFTIHIRKREACEIMPEKTEKEMVVFVRSNTIGRGADELGTILMRSFIPTLLEIEQKPNKMVLVNSGVKLAVEESPVLEFMQEIEREGVELLVCGTCLDFFDLKDKVKVGRVSNMFELVSILSEADKVLSM